MYANRRNFASFRKSGSRNTMVTSDFRPQVEIRPFRACAMHPAIIIGTVRSLWTWLWCRYHVPQNAFLVSNTICQRGQTAAVHHNNRCSRTRTMNVVRKLLIVLCRRIFTIALAMAITITIRISKLLLQLADIRRCVLDDITEQTNFAIQRRSHQLQTHTNI